MTRRFTFLAALALVASFATGVQAQTAVTVGFAGFSQSAGTETVDYTRTPGANPLPSYLTASSEVVFTISNPQFLIDPMGQTLFTGATFTLNAESWTDAIEIADNQYQEGFFGSFSIIGSGGENLLSGSFNSGVLSQRRANLASFESADVDFTSDIFYPVLGEEFIFSIGGGFTNLVIDNGAFQNFTGDRISGDFAAIPEPATLAMAGLGILALPLAVRAARRRRSVSSN